ncbi:hypothetical protein [Actinotignum schaalii]|uniref:hypothetical protein n=1 Tax=Actinotignum schaalii TaxID=59505 RepID=UPI000408F733|nr:hypothetical protein [Actinotignum schaalii]AIE83231.1 hypothetical protein FB03_08310 [Actinotignum schaalii]WQN45435.1 hypothetical protein U4A90_01700 [Actinotignum schaalii]
MEDFLALPVPAQIALGIVALIQLSLLITSLVLLSRWPERQLAGVPRLGWVVIVLLGSLVGTLLFLFMYVRANKSLRERHVWEEQSAAARVLGTQASATQAPATQAPATQAANASETVRELYG